MGITVALDIETDTSPLTEDEKAEGYESRGLDPRISRITSIALANSEGEITVITDPSEAQMIRDLEDYLNSQDVDRLVTWNGACFDIPFISDRAYLNDVEISLQMRHNPDIVPKYQPTPGHRGGYDAWWSGAEHVDVAFAAKDECLANDVRWSLKPYAEFLGLDPVVVDASKMHELSPEEEVEYVASDARVTLEIFYRQKLAGLVE